MTVLIKEELDRIKKLMVHESGDMSSLTEQTEETTCEMVKVNGTFDVNATENEENLVKFINTFNEVLEKDPRIKEAAEKGTAYISYFEIVGGASNVGGGKAVKPTLGNDYYAPKSDGKKYTGDQAAQIKLATSRGKNVSDWFREKLVTDYKIPMGKDAEIKAIRGEVIDTGGVNDDDRDEDLYKNPGQIVFVKFNVCGLSKKGGSITKECFTDLVVEVAYDQAARDHIGNNHNCNSAIFEIQANGVTLKEDGGQMYANLNNAGSGGFRYAKFSFSEGVNKDNIQTMIQNGVKNNYKGKLVIKAICGGKGKSMLGDRWKCTKETEGKDSLGCHEGVAHLSATRAGKPVEDMIGKSPRCLNDDTTLGAIEACKPV